MMIRMAGLTALGCEGGDFPQAHLPQQCLVNSVWDVHNMLNLV